MEVTRRIGRFVLEVNVEPYELLGIVYFVVAESDPFLWLLNVRSFSGFINFNFNDSKVFGLFIYLSFLGFS